MLKKTRQDLKNHKYQVAALAIILGIGAGVVIGLEHFAYWRQVSLDESYDRHNMMDLQIDLLQDAYANISDIEPLLASIEGLKAAEFRMVANVGVNISTSSQFQIVQGKIIGINVTASHLESNTNRPVVNNYKIKAGQSLAPEDKNNSVCLIEHAFADYHNLIPSQSFSIILSNQIHLLTIKGLAYFVEYYFVSSDDRSILSSESQFAAMYLPLRTAQNLLSRPGKFNQLIVRTTEGKAESVQAQLVALLKNIGYDSTALLRNELATYHYLYEQLKNDYAVYRTSAAIFLLIVALGIYIMVSRLISSQRRLIGISRALGHSSRRIIGQYVLFSTIIGVFGSLLGAFIGFFLSSWYFDIYSQFVALPYWQSPLQWHFFAAGLLFPIIIAMAAGFLPAFSASRMKVIDAIRLDPFSDTASQTRPGIAQRFIRVLPFSLSLKLPIRNVLRNRRRTLTTVFGLSISVILSISFLGIFDSFDAVMKDVDEDLGTWDLNARASGFESASEWESVLANHSQPSGFERWEVCLDLIVKLTHNSRSLDVFLSGIHPNSALRPVELAKGSLEDEGIMVSRRTARDLGLSVGDDVLLEHIMLGGPTGYYLETTTLKIAGIHDSVIALYCFMTLEAIQELINATGAVNSVYLTLGDLSKATAQKILYTQLPGVVTVEFIEPVLRDRQDAVNEQRDILWPGLFFSMVLAFAMVMNTVVINVAERTRETGAMLTLGTPKWVVARMILIENLLLSFSGLGLGMVLGQLTLEHVFINGALKESLPQLILPIVINPASGGLVLGLFLAAICLGQIAGIRRAIGLDLAVATKTLE